MIKHSIAAVCALALGSFGFASTSFAGDNDTSDTSKESKVVKETVKETCITGDLGVTMTNEYLSRGLVLNSKGVVAQPYLDLYFKLYEGTGFINKITFNFGLWSDLNSHVQNPISTLRNWYEFDYTPGVSFTFAKNFTFTASYFEFDSPGQDFATARSINMNLAYDDTDLLGAFALHPHVAVLSELPAPGEAGLAPGGWYYEIGLAPSYTFGKGSTYPVTFSVPLTTGLGSANFYKQDGFGYFSAGAQLAVPLAFIPACYGTWTFSGGYTYYYLGNALQEFSAGNEGDGHHSQNVFQGAIGLTF
jgi:hypothetical protein